MSKSKRDILDTEAMLTRLTNLLVEHANRQADDYWIGRARGDAESLRRISMTLHRWHELECGTDEGCIERDGENGDGRPFWRSPNAMPGCRFWRPDRERGALKRLAKILKNYPGLNFHVQGDPRGAALYILKPGDVPEGATVDSCYSRGLAVHK